VLNGILRRGGDPARELWAIHDSTEARALLTLIVYTDGGPAWLAATEIAGAVAGLCVSPTLVGIVTHGGERTHPAGRLRTANRPRTLTCGGSRPDDIDAAQTRITPVSRCTVHLAALNPLAGDTVLAVG
jgi:hypothetical protein